MAPSVKVFKGGPGTGKTTKLISIAVDKLKSGTDPNSILLLTFGRERASNLRDEIAFKSQVTALEPLARTFHALAFSILKAEGVDPILFSGPEQESWIRQLLKSDEWPTDIKGAIGTRGFVREVRDLIARATERGWRPENLKGENYWEDAAKFWRSYEGSLNLDPVIRLDSSQLVWQAATLLKNDEAIRNKWQNRFKLILVDEFQECDKSQRALLEQIAGFELIIGVDSDSTVGRFRGADPEGIDQALDKFKPEVIDLIDNFRNSKAVSEALKLIVDKFPGSKRDTNNCRAEEGKFEKHLFAEASDEAAFIADQIQRAFLKDEIKWSDIAIIVRTPAAANAIRRALIRSDIPIASELQVISENVSLEPILLMAECAIAGSISYQAAEKLLLSEIGGSDALDLRRIRRALVDQYSEIENKSGAELIRSAIIDGGLEIPGGAALEKVHQVYLKARKVAKDKSSQPEDLLWAIWSSTTLPERWRSAALNGGVRGAFADRDLDAAMQLFESARRYGARFPFGAKEVFLKDIRKSEIAGDVITARGSRPDVVEILTPYSAKGREWKLVFIAGIQEGIWPNLKVRGSLLGSDRLVERDRYPELNKVELELVAKAAVQEDELRLFYVAASRASNQLVLTAISNEEDEPSTFFTLFGDVNEITQIGPRLNISSLIARLRRELAEENSLDAAASLKALAEAGFESAEPKNWYGVNKISTTEELLSQGDEVRISPSGVDKFIECELRWFFESNGGQSGDTTAQMIGNIIHKFAEKSETEGATFEEQCELLEKNWRLVDEESGWISKSSKGRALLILKRFYQYREEFKFRKFEVSEKIIDFKIGNARFKGSIDRVEIDADGKSYLIDFKTGTTSLTKAEASKNKQLEIYQLALLSEGRDVSGASLVYLNHDGIKSKTREQSSVAPESEKITLEIASIAEKMSGKVFTARVNKNCQFCNVRTSCPLQSEGRNLYDI